MDAKYAVCEDFPSMFSIYIKIDESHAMRIIACNWAKGNRKNVHEEMILIIESIEMGERKFPKVDEN